MDRQAEVLITRREMNYSASGLTEPAILAMKESPEPHKIVVKGTLMARIVASCERQWELDHFDYGRRILYFELRTICHGAH